MTKQRWRRHEEYSPLDTLTIIFCFTWLKWFWTVSRVERAYIWAIVKKWQNYSLIEMS